MNDKTTTLTGQLTQIVVTLALLAGAESARSADGVDSAQAFETAMAAYERNHWYAAYTAFGTLADRGHPEAARIALQMWLYGPMLYTTSFVAPAQQLQRWSRVWSHCSSDPTGGACLLAHRAP